MSKKHYPFLTESIFLAVQTKGDESLQHAIKGIINMAESFTIGSKKQTSSLVFSLLRLFYNMFILYWSSRVERVLILNMGRFLPFFIRKCLQILTKQRKRQKTEKLKVLAKPPKKWTPPNSGQY